MYLALTDALTSASQLLSATSELEGAGISFACLEELQRSRAYILFATHFPQLKRLAQLYSNVKLHHLKVTDNSRIEYSYQVEPGMWSHDRSVFLSTLEVRGCVHRLHWAPTTWCCNRLQECRAL